MAEAPNLTTSKVRLWDRLQSNYNVGSGDGLVLHPETELSAVILTTDNYIVSSGNSLKLDTDNVWSGNISARVASEYCPLVKVISGSTQYADMYVNNGTATVTEIPTSTGYGTLLHALSTITSVRAVSGSNSATNDYIPTERAVALALEGKQQLLSGGVCINLTSGLNYTDISVNVQSDTPLPPLSNATQTKVPTEYVVRHAIDIASESLNSRDIVLNGSITSLSSYVVNSTVKKTEYATTGSAGIVKIGSGLAMSGTNNDTLYVTATGGLQSFTVIAGTGIAVTGSSATGCTVSLVGDVTAGYNGPFRATSVGSAVVAITGGTAINTKVSVAGGYVKWLDGNKWIVGSDTSTQTPVTSWTLSSATSDATKGWIGPSLTPDDTALYLVGSSGAVAGQDIKAHSYSATVDDGTTQIVYTRTESQNATTSRFKWTSASGSMWAEPNLALDTVAYTDATGTTPIGSITNYKGTITLGTGSNAVVYTRSSTNEESFVPSWIAANGEVQYTASAWPASSATTNPVKTLYKIDAKFGYSTSQGGLPPAGSFYTMLAQNQGGTIVQQQYGTVWHEHWGDDYNGQFAISRVALNDMSATQLPTPDTYPYAYIIDRGGQLYGGIDFSSGRIWAGGLTVGGVMLTPGDIMYPTKSVNGTNKNDGLYFPYGTAGQVWLNVWSGTWPGVSDQESWYTVVDSKCLEGTIPGCYSVQLGWVTPNGAPQQEHKGPVAIRGRWG